MARLSRYYLTVIIRYVKVNVLHNWHLTVAEAIDLQRRLAAGIIRTNELRTPHFVAGVDVSVRKGDGVVIGAVVILSYPDLRMVEIKVAQEKLDFPYVPGLLSFRELPVILDACQRLEMTPDLILVDGQGIAHPRRFGLASHLGLLLDKPAIGCAKSRLCGQHETPGLEAGNYTEVVDNGEIIGAALRTKRNVRPVYASVGHKIDLVMAVHQVLACCRGYRLPEPIRIAHLAAGGNLEPKIIETQLAENSRK